MRHFKKQMAIRAELKRIKREIQLERVSYGELAFIQNHTAEILKMGDILLAEWAGIPEDVFHRVCDGIGA